MISKVLILTLFTICLAGFAQAGRSSSFYPGKSSYLYNAGGLHSSDEKRFGDYGFGKVYSKIRTLYRDVNYCKVVDSADAADFTLVNNVAFYSWYEIVVVCKSRWGSPVKFLVDFTAYAKCQKNAKLNIKAIRIIKKDDHEAKPKVCCIEIAGATTQALADNPSTDLTERKVCGKTGTLIPNVASTQWVKVIEFLEEEGKLGVDAVFFSIEDTCPNFELGNASGLPATENFDTAEEIQCMYLVCEAPAYGDSYKD